MRTFILFVIVMVAILTSCHPDKIQDEHLNQWIGHYSGEAFYGSSHPSYPVGTGWTSERDTLNVVVEVTKGDSISSLTFAITYDDSILKHHENLIFSDSGYHYSQWGGGSSAGSLKIQFTQDSLLYNYSQKCGIPCSYGYYFRLRR